MYGKESYIAVFNHKREPVLSQLVNLDWLIVGNTRLLEASNRIINNGNIREQLLMQNRIRHAFLLRYRRHLIEQRRLIREYFADLTGTYASVSSDSYGAGNTDTAAHELQYDCRTTTC